jgi:hypothetical protein
VPNLKGAIEQVFVNLFLRQIRCESYGKGHYRVFGSRNGKDAKEDFNLATWQLARIIEIVAKPPGK